MKLPITPKPIDIIIPVYNEGEVIIKTLNEIRDNVSVDFNILIIYDFDEDNTLPVVNKYIEGNKAANIFLVKNLFQRGVLNAIKTGFQTAVSEAVLVVMGDASDDLAVVGQMYKKLEEGSDVVCGSRYMKGGKQIGGPVFKKFLSRMAGTSLYFLTGIPSHDVSNSFKLYRKSAINNIQIESTGGFEIGMEILVKSFISGKKIAEVPSTWRDRTGGKSKFKLLKWLPHYLHWYLMAIKHRWSNEITPNSDKARSKKSFFYSALLFSLLTLFSTIFFLKDEAQTIRIDFNKPYTGSIEAFYNINRNDFSEKNSSTVEINGTIAEIPLPRKIKKIRIGFKTESSTIELKSFSVGNKKFEKEYLINELTPENKANKLHKQDDTIIFQTQEKNSYLLLNSTFSYSLLRFVFTLYLNLLIAIICFLFLMRYSAITYIKTIFSILFKSFVAISIFLISIPFAPRMPRMGIDDSWILSMNETISQHLTIGKDLIFTFGPYASIYTGAYHPKTNHLMFIGFFILCSCFIFLLFKISKGKSLYLTLGLLFIMFTDGNFKIFSYPLLFAIFIYNQAGKTKQLGASNIIDLFCLTIACIPLGLLPIVKGSNLSICLGIEIIAAMLFLYKKKSWHALITIMAPLLSSFALWLISGQRVIGFAPYFFNMFQLITGYTEAMALPGPISHILLFIAASFSIIFAIIYSVKRDKIASGFFLALAFSLFLYNSFKAGFVRHDAHAIIASSSLLFASIMLCFLFSNKSTRLSLFISLITWALIDSTYSESSTKSSISRIQYVYINSLNAINKWIDNPEELFNNYDKELMAIKEKMNIPNLDGSCDIFSFEQSILIASGNKWNPRPIFQSYAAYTPKLAKLNEQHFRSSNAPDNVLFVLQPIGMHFPSLEDGLSWPALFDNYKSTKFGNGILYLKKDVCIQKESSFKTLLINDKCKLGQEILLPHTTDKLFIEIDIRPTFLGKIFNLLYKLPTLEIITTSDDNQERSFQTVSNMMRTGFFISPLVQNTEQLAFVFMNDCSSLEWIKSFKIRQKQGHSILWKSTYKIRLKAYDDKYMQYNKIDGIFNTLSKSTPAGYSLGETIHCDGSIDLINEKPLNQPIKCKSNMKISGWLAISAKEGRVSDETFLTLKKASEPIIYIKATRTSREDVKRFFNSPQMLDAGYSATIDLSSLKGKYNLGLAAGINHVLYQSEQFSVPIELE